MQYEIVDQNSVSQRLQQGWKVWGDPIQENLNSESAAYPNRIYKQAMIKEN